jgi:hypothetical protein
MSLNIWAEFTEWVGNNAYIEWRVWDPACSDLGYGAKFWLVVIKWRNTERTMCSVVASYGFTTNAAAIDGCGLKYSHTDYIPGNKIDYGDITISLGVTGNPAILDPCYEGDYHPGNLRGGITKDVYIPPKLEKCTQSFKVRGSISKESIQGAAVTIWELPYPECATGTDGRCSISNLQKGKTYHVVVNKAGYYAGGGDFVVCAGEITIELTEIVECSPEGAHKVLEYCPDGVTEKRWKDCVSGKWIEKSKSCPECTGVVHEVLEYCPDGVTEKRWRDCIGGVWVENSQSCPECFPEGKSEVLEYCPDGVTAKRWRKCTGGKWLIFTFPCPECSPEGAHVVLEYCPDGITEKRWKDCISGKWRFDSRECPPGKCTEGKTKCINFDLYKCINGRLQLIEEKSLDCGYVPSEGETRCVGKDLYKSVEGGWVLYVKNAPQCSYEPPPPCPLMCICMGTPLVDCLGPIRQLRDEILAKCKTGRRFISFYYGRLTPRLSPIILNIRGIRRV